LILPGSTISQAAAINDRGQVAGCSPGRLMLPAAHSHVLGYPGWV